MNKTVPITLVLLMQAALTGCYGTKVGPPTRSILPPPGLYALSTRPIALPDNLTDLLALYRQTLIEQSHQLKPPDAARYADAEIAGLKRSHAGRDSELKNEVSARLRAHLGAPPANAQNPQAATYPQDPGDRAQENRK